MNENKKKWIEAQGFEVTTVDAFLELTPEEVAFIDFKLAMAKKVKEVRKRKKMTQAQLSYQTNSDQPRVSRMENGDPSVSLDVIFQSLFSLGIDKKELAETILSPSFA